MRIRILTSALDDLAAGEAFYESMSEGLGDYFYDCLFSDIGSLALYGGIDRKIHGYHRSLSHRFPYAIYYKMDPEGCVVVWRVLDCRQNPQKMVRALKKDQ